MSSASDLREMDDAELVTRLAEAKEELFNLRFQHATGQLDAYSRLGEVRREIARLSTVVRAREIEAAETLAASPEPDGDAETESDSEET